MAKLISHIILLATILIVPLHTVKGQAKFSFGYKYHYHNNIYKGNRTDGTVSTRMGYLVGGITLPRFSIVSLRISAGFLVNDKPSPFFGGPLRYEGTYTSAGITLSISDQLELIGGLYRYNREEIQFKTLNDEENDYLPASTSSLSFGGILAGFRITGNGLYLEGNARFHPVEKYWVKADLANDPVACGVRPENISFLVSVGYIISLGYNSSNSQKQESSSSYGSVSRSGSRESRSERADIDNSVITRKHLHQAEEFMEQEKYELAREELQSILKSDIASARQESEAQRLLSVIERKMEAESRKKEVFVYPLKRKYRITSGFYEVRKNDSGREYYHYAVDIAAPHHARIRAIGDGVVMRAQNYGSCGKNVLIKHANGFTSSYCHLKNIYVEKYERVDAYEIIGTVGNTGKTDGTHLHLKLRKDGKPVTPSTYIKGITE